MKLETATIEQTFFFQKISLDSTTALSSMPFRSWYARRKKKIKKKISPAAAGRTRNDEVIRHTPCVSVNPVESSPVEEEGEGEGGGGGCIASTGASLKRRRERRRRRRKGLGLIRTEAKSNEEEEEEEDSTFQLGTPRTTPKFANTDAEK